MHHIENDDHGRRLARSAEVTKVVGRQGFDIVLREPRETEYAATMRIAEDEAVANADALFEFLVIPVFIDWIASILVERMIAARSLM